MGIYVQIRKTRLRRDQVRYFGEIVLKGIEQLQRDEEQGPLYVPGPDMTLSPDQLRHTHYDQMRRMINGAIEHRASEITYDAICELQDAFYAVNWAIDNHRGAPKNLFDKMANDLRKICWLRIKP